MSRSIVTEPSAGDLVLLELSGECGGIGVALNRRDGVGVVRFGRIICVAG